MNFGIKKIGIFLIIIGLSFIITQGIAFPQLETGVPTISAPTTSAPTSAPTSAVPPDSDEYVIGPEDTLVIQVWKEPQLSETVMVRKDGKISLPLIDEIQASGLTPLQLKDLLTREYKQFVETPIVTVIVRDAKSFKVYIGGQVAKPGVYTLVKEITILQLIPLAGGFTQWANQRKILLIRNEGGKETRFIINYKKIVSGEELSNNIVIKSGDTVIVPD
jgi:polysaccharide biosynthesis/export protein